MANKKTERGLGASGLRAYSPAAEAKYIGIRGGLSRTFYLNEVLDQQLFMHLQKEYGNVSEIKAILKLTGRLEALRLGFKLTATKKDMMRYYALAEKARYDRKYGLTQVEAVARFATGKIPKKISRSRPSEFKAKPNTPYKPRIGSSKGKVKTIVRGGKPTLQALEKFIKALFSMQPDGRKAHMPTVRRTISKIIDE